MIIIIIIIMHLIKEVICEATCCPCAQTQPPDTNTETQQRAENAAGDGVRDEQFLKRENIVYLREGFKNKIKKKYGIFHTFLTPPSGGVKYGIYL